MDPETNVSKKKSLPRLLALVLAAAVLLSAGMGIGYWLLPRQAQAYPAAQYGYTQLFEAFDYTDPDSDVWQMYP